MSTRVSGATQEECLEALGTTEAKLISVEERVDHYTDESRAIEEGKPLDTIFEKRVTIVTMEKLGD